MSIDPADPSTRQTYQGSGLAHLDTRGPVVAPLGVLQQWWQDAVADPRVYEPAAMGLATVDASGLPNLRTVLMRDLDADGITFFTNLGSAKAQELGSGQAAVCLSWHAMFRTLRLRGTVSDVDRDQVQAYWSSRPHGSQVASAASQQSSPLESRADLEAAVASLQARYDGRPVPLPTGWGGYRLQPVEVECWVGLPSRLHDRVQWRASSGPVPLDRAAGWRWTRLQP